jgi:hypothetical protein
MEPLVYANKPIARFLLISAGAVDVDKDHAAQKALAAIPQTTIDSFPGALRAPDHPSSPSQAATEGGNIPFASADTLAGAFAIVPAGPPTLFQSGASFELSSWAGATSPTCSRTWKATCPNDFPVPRASLGAAEQGALAISSFAIEKR